MRVRELFEKADMEKIARKLAYDTWDIKIDNRKTEEEKNMERETIRIHIMQSFHKMMEENKECPDQDIVIVCTKCVDLTEGTDYLDATLVHLSDLNKEIFIPDYDNRNQDPIPQEEFEKKYIQNYAFDFSPWSEILGAYVADASINRYGMDEVAKEIYDEMTFFGYDQDNRDERADTEMEKLHESMREVEEHPERLIPWETVKKDLEEKFDLEPKTAEEEEESYQKLVEEMKINKEESIKIMSEVKKQFL